MIRLPPLDQASLVRLTREGGLAYLPRRSQPRSFDLENCTEELRQRIAEALQSAASHAHPRSGGEPGGGDQRYYRVEVVVKRADSVVSFEVPEAEAPEALVHLWQAAGSR